MSNGYGCYVWRGHSGKVHKIGATLDWAGPVQIDQGYPDISAWAVSAVINGNGFKAHLAATLAWTGEKTVLRLFAAPGAQGGWKEGETFLDVRFAAPDGTILITPTAKFFLERAVTRA